MREMQKYGNSNLQKLTLSFVRALLALASFRSARRRILSRFSCRAASSFWMSEARSFVGSTSGQERGAVFDGGWTSLFSLGVSAAGPMLLGSFWMSEARFLVGSASHACAPQVSDFVKALRECQSCNIHRKLPSNSRLRFRLFLIASRRGVRIASLRWS